MGGGGTLHVIYPFNYDVNHTAVKIDSVPLSSASSTVSMLW